MRYLALDIGKRRTGVAYFDDATGIPLPLDTIEASSAEEWKERVLALIAARRIDRIVVGLPRLLSGEEGEQARFARERSSLLADATIPVEFVDERYTNHRVSKKGKNGPKQPRGDDGDAAAACEILRISRKS